MKGLIEFIARALVDEPDEVEVIERESHLDLELVVADDDLGTVIGHKGKTAQAMRTLLRALVPDDDRVELEITSPSESAAE